jgi:tRNA threonylcarbamoyladenosine modification (KEOPS) complex Cgi121 subunit
VIQLVGGRRLPSAAAVEMVAAQTLRAKTSGSLLVKRPELDLLLRLAGTSQIGEALEEIGYKRKGKKVLVAAGPGSGLARLAKSLAGDARLKRVRKGPLTEDDLEVVETAALVAARL